MKIAIIGPAYPYRGGIAAFTGRLAEAFLEEGEEVTIYTFTLQYPGFLFPGKSQYSESSPPRHLTIERCINSINPINWIWAGNRIRKARPDLVIVKFWLPFMGLCFGTLLRIIRLNRHSRIICIVHNMIPHEKRPGDRWFTKYFVKSTDAFLAMSQSVLDDIGQFDTQKPRTLSPHPLYDHFGETEPREKALARLGLSPDFQYILFFGLIRPYKGLDLLLRAMADERLKNEKIKLIIAGEYYDDREKYLKLIKELKLSNRIIEVNRFIPDEEVAHYFNAADLVVQPYKSATQSGVTQIAYHFNKPMIVTDVGGLRDLCPDGKTGYVVRPDPVAIAGAIYRFFYQTDKVAMIENIIGEKEKYSWQVFTRNIYELAVKI